MARSCACQRGQLEFLTHVQFILLFVAVWILIEFYHHKTMAKLSSLAATLTAVISVLEKIEAEVKAIHDSDVELPPEVEASLGRIQQLVKSIDDANPDAPAPPS